MPKTRCCGLFGAMPEWSEAMATEEVTEPIEAENDGAKPDIQLGDAGKAAIAAERKRAAAAEKSVKELSDKLKELEDKDKSEAEKLRDSLTEAQTELDNFRKREQVEAWRTEVVAETELAADIATALRGSTREELAEHAALLKQLFASQKQPLKGPYVPTEGKTPTGQLGSKGQVFADLFGQ